MRESSTIKLSVKFHALYHIELVSARRKVSLSPVKQNVEFCIIISPKRKSSAHHSSKTWVVRARWSEWRWSMKPKAIFDFTTHLPAKMPPKWDLSLHCMRKECVFKTCDLPPKWDPSLHSARKYYAFKICDLPMKMSPRVGLQVHPCPLDKALRVI